jgi:hypothetical protein
MKNKWAFVINKDQATIEVQWLDEDGKAIIDEIFSKNGPFPADFDYQKIVSVLENYKIGTGDYFDINGNILDFMGNIKQKSKTPNTKMKADD